MDEKSDAQLLREYAEVASEPAFRELVQRHADFVYSAALRQVNSPDFASDIAQEVFTDLARKAKPLSEKAMPNGSLTGWLHRSTRYEALNHLRDSRRRLANERQAMDQLLNDSEAVTDWECIRPVLDEALDSLNDADREALLLRYFKNQNFRAVGQALGVSDDVAQKRVSRAVERLRKFFSKRSIVVSATALTLLISANAVQSAPAALMVTLPTAALTSAAVSSSALATAAKVVTVTALQKILATAAVVVLVWAGTYEARQTSRLREQNRTLQQQSRLLSERFQALQRERDDATNRLEGLLAENARLRSNPYEAELLKLRAEVTRLSADSEELARLNDADATAKAWRAKVQLLKDYFQRNPDAAIPEIQFMKGRDWLASIDPSANYFPLQTDKDYDNAIDEVRNQAQLDFEILVNNALAKFSQESKQAFPTNLAQLRPYCDPAVADVLEQQYEMAPTGSLPAVAIPSSGKIDGDWMIARKSSATAHGQRMTILPMKISEATYYQLSFY